jgi:AraC-like DNA-binding protein
MLPFLRILRRKEGFPVEALAALDAMDPDARLSISVSNRMLDAAVAITGDLDLGLKAARELTIGEAGALEYAITSASTVRDAIDTAARYVRLVNDALELRVEVSGARARVEIHDRVPVPRAAVDFEVAGLFRTFRSVWALCPAPPKVLFPHGAPADRLEYVATFGAASLVFGAAHAGFELDAGCLDLPLPSADSNLHAVIRQHAERILAELPRAHDLVERVRDAIARELAGGNPSVAQVAKALRTSPRTLERRLEREGTTFSGLLDELRKRLALRYVGTLDLDLSEVAFLLGFSQTTAFHRAFKRWTGDTPLGYRRAHREGGR